MVIYLCVFLVYDVFICDFVFVCVIATVIRYYWLLLCARMYTYIYDTTLFLKLLCAIFTACVHCCYRNNFVLMQV